MVDGMASAIQARMATVAVAAAAHGWTRRVGHAATAISSTMDARWALAVPSRKTANAIIQNRLLGASLRKVATRRKQAMTRTASALHRKSMLADAVWKRLMGTSSNASIAGCGQKM